MIDSLLQEWLSSNLQVSNSKLMDVINDTRKTKAGLLSAAIEINVTLCLAERKHSRTLRHKMVIKLFNLLPLTRR